MRWLIAAGCACVSLISVWVGVIIGRDRGFTRAKITHEVWLRRYNAVSDECCALRKRLNTITRNTHTSEE